MKTDDKLRAVLAVAFVNKNGAVEYVVVREGKPHGEFRVQPCDTLLLTLWKHLHELPRWFGVAERPLTSLLKQLP